MRTKWPSCGKENQRTLEQMNCVPAVHPWLTCQTAAKRRVARLLAYVPVPQLEDMLGFLRYLRLAQQLQGVCS
jgi:hypothetical protein